MPRSPSRPRAFSLIELVIVVVIIGIIAAIAVPRLGNAAQNSQSSAIKGDLKVLTSAVEVYTAEHNGLTPAQFGDGSADTSAAGFLARLLSPTASDGTASGTVIYGPYLRTVPPNPANKLNSIRIDGASAGAGTHGWRYDSALRTFQADDSIADAAVALEVSAAAGVPVGP